ncbi:MAG: phosphate ABC transporter ATP-binding protein PstB [Trueperaceae bacterium]
MTVASRTVPSPVAHPRAAEAASTVPSATVKLEVRDLTVRYGNDVAVDEVSLPVRAHRVTALIGPSGCGKSSFLRALNRMHDLTPSAKVSGSAVLDGGMEVCDPRSDPVTIRRKIGMVFQKPTPFPTMSIFDNVAAGLRLVGIRKRVVLDDAVETALRQAVLWDEVKDRLRAPAAGLSGGQQQRLSIARALAVRPEVLLMDEPTSALDPQATQAIEDLILRLKDQVTILVVTHNLQQARRVSDVTAFFYLGRLIEAGETEDLFANPREARTADYLSGRFG